MRMNGLFRVTNDHLALLHRAVIRFEDEIEYGAPAMDPKRPYGNSDVPRDIAEILGWDFDDEFGPNDTLRKAARAIHEEMAVVLQILVSHYGESIVGDWDGGKYGFKWVRADVEVAS